jgi:hypothetical protein
VRNSLITEESDKMIDAKTKQIVAEWVAKYDAAVQAEDFPEMMRIITICESSPNRPFKRELMLQLDLIAA